MANGTTVMAARTESLLGLVLHEERLPRIPHRPRRRELGRGVSLVSVRNGAAQSHVPYNLSADHLNGRSYLLLRRQPVPGQNGFLQCGAISLYASSIVEGRGLPGIDIDFVVVAHQPSQSPGVRYLLGDDPMARGTAQLRMDVGLLMASHRRSGRDNSPNPTWSMLQLTDPNCDPISRTLANNLGSAFGLIVAAVPTSRCRLVALLID